MPGRSGRSVVGPDVRCEGLLVRAFSVSLGKMKSFEISRAIGLSSINRGKCLHFWDVGRRESEVGGGCEQCHT